jgi:hypothetical protein
VEPIHASAVGMNDKIMPPVRSKERRAERDLVDSVGSTEATPAVQPAAGGGSRRTAVAARGMRRAELPGVDAAACVLQGIFSFFFTFFFELTTPPVPKLCVIPVHKLPKCVIRVPKLNLVLD